MQFLQLIIYHRMLLISYSRKYRFDFTGPETQYQDEITLNGSEPPLSSPANTARLTAPKYSASLRPSVCKKSS